MSAPVLLAAAAYVIFSFGFGLASAALRQGDRAMSPRVARDIIGVGLVWAIFLPVIVLFYLGVVVRERIDL